MPEPIRYRNKMMQLAFFYCGTQTEMTDAGMPMLALVLQMPMPSYAGMDMERVINHISYKLCDFS
jgi:hypothetical protein